jgi:hypothetical protein
VGHATPPGCEPQQAVKGPKYGHGWKVIYAILEEDKRRPARQRHTATPIYHRLRAEYVFSGGQAAVTDCTRTQRLRSEEMFVPVVHVPGEAKADSGEALPGVAGVAHCIVMDLPYSDVLRAGVSGGD